MISKTELNPLEAMLKEDWPNNQIIRRKEREYSRWLAFNGKKFVVYEKQLIPGKKRTIILLAEETDLLKAIKFITQ
jgi:hypothetical protein